MYKSGIDSLYLVALRLKKKTLRESRDFKISYRIWGVAYKVRLSADNQPIIKLIGRLSPDDPPTVGLV